ncbi:FAD/NAD(P)-binding domain-containing protein [Mycena galopus ATCC 62051]|nr:FAD/NAD(P)-binding domain-containing protein [Mycena galopus ATCC 62051]
MYFRQATFQIDAVIVGGGIGGLACAYALGRTGHHVRVLEKSDGSQRGTGVRMPPNVTKILVEWGLEAELKKLCTSCRKTTFLSHSGETLGILEWQEDVLQETGGQFLLMSYDDLYQMLQRLALSVGVVITFNATVTAVQSMPTPSVHFNGTILTADLIIGADGGKSLTREFVTEKKDTARDGGHTFYTVFIPIERIVDPVLAKWAHAPQWPVMVGDNRCALGYPAGNQFCFIVVWPDQDIPAAGDVPEAWDVTCPTSILDLASYNDRIHRLFSLASTVQRTKYVYRDRVEDWVDHSGRILLVGEAAHPTMPHSTHGPSMAIEDAEALGVLMSHLSGPEQIPQLTEGFQELRQTRCDFTHFSELSNMMFSMMPPGEERDNRDALLRKSLETGVEQWDEGMLRTQWEQIEVGFGYHMREAAENWWKQWGSLDDKAKKGDGEVAIQVASSTA